MKLTILGSGTDASQLPGIPNRYPPGFLVDWGEEQLLLECSEGIRFRLEQAGYDYTQIKHLAISHSHPDHYALPQFVQSVWNNLQWSKRLGVMHELNIYCPEQIAREFKEHWLKFRPFDDNYLPQPILNFIPLLNTEKIQIGRAVLSTAKVYHDWGKLDALAFRIEVDGKAIVYSGDTGDCEGIHEITSKADLFICECSANISDAKNATGYGHMNARQAGEISRDSKVKKLVFFHYTGLDSDEAIIEDCRRSGFVGEITVAKDFQTHTI